MLKKFFVLTALIFSFCAAFVFAADDGKSVIKIESAQKSEYRKNKDTKEENEKEGKPNVGIGKNCRIAKTIIDKNASIGDNCRINVDGNKYPDGDHGLFYSADGIIVIRKGVVIPAGTVI